MLSRSERDALNAHYDDILAEAGAVVPETIAAILAAGALAVRQHRRDGHFDRRAHKRCLMERGGLGADAADMLTDALEDALRLPSGPHAKAGEPPRGWRRDILAAIIRHSLRQPQTTSDAE